jgi:hypothetical protein
VTTFLVTGVVGNTLSVVPSLDQTYLIGTRVGVFSVNATLADPAAVGAVTVTLTDVTGVTVGTLLGITDPVTGATEYRTVTGVSGSIVTLAAPLGASYGAGAGSSQAPSFLPGIIICDKAGNVLGSTTDYTVNASRSFSIGAAGSMGFYMPRTSPDVALIKSDYLVAVGNEVGVPMWAGTITTQDWSGSTGNIHCEDVYSLLTGVPIEIDLEVMDDTPATAIYRAVIDLVNTRRGLDGEIQWGVDLQGTKPFMGDFAFSGDPDTALRTIADRSGTEYGWSAALDNGKLALTLVVRDSFSESPGVPFTDGEGGNVVSAPSYLIDPTTIINGIRLNGDTTDIKRYVDDWAEWAVHDIEPVVEIYADTGDYRRRIDLSVNVDISLSKRQQRALAQATQDEVWNLYERYLYAIHDIRGTINHPGWVYEGPPEDIEPDLTKDKWHTHVELARFRDSRPAAIVMESSSSWLAVTYNLTWSTKDVRIWGKESTYTPKVAHISVKPGTHSIYEESGGAGVYDLHQRCY